MKTETRVIGKSAIALGLTAAFLTGSTSAQAAAGNLAGPEIVVAPHGFSGAVARDAAGEFVVAYVYSERGSPEAIMVQRYTAEGVPAGPASEVSDPGRHVSVPSVAMDAEGDFVVSWTEYLVNGRDVVAGYLSGVPRVMARRFAAGGVAQGGAIVVAAFGGNSDVAIDDQGDFVVGWLSGGGLGQLSPIGFYGPNLGLAGLDGVHVRRYSANGKPQDIGKTVQTRPHSEVLGLNITSISVAMSPAGDYVVAWDRDNGDQIRAHRYRANGQSIAPDFQVNTPTESSSDFVSRPSVALTRSGTMIVAWQTRTNVRCKLYAADGSVAVPDFYAATGEPGLDAAPEVAVADAGNFVITAGDSSKVRSRMFSFDGTPTTGVVATTTDPNRSQSPFAHVASDAVGNAVVVWTDQQGGVSAQRITGR